MPAQIIGLAEQKPYTPREFFGALNNSERVRSVADGLRQLWQDPAYTPTEHFRIGVPVKESGEVEIAHIKIPGSIDMSFGVPLALPRMLRADIPMPRTEALELAAVYGISFAMMQTRIQRAMRQDITLKDQVVTSRRTYQPKLWSERLQACGQTGERVALPYRAAGTLALHVINSPSLTPKGLQPPFPLPIAGLANPLNQDEFRLFKTVLK